MALFEVGGTSTLTPSGANLPIVGFSCTSRARILEIGITLTSAVNTQLQLVRPSTLSAGSPTGIVSGQNTEELGGISVARAFTGMPATAPVIAANTGLRFVSIVATVGSGVIFSWPYDRPLFVGNNNGTTGELYIATASAVVPGAFNFYISWEE